jgi:putative transcriptional regulator
MLNAKKGRLLISEPSLDDPIFFKSVILITYYSNDESIGLILNQATKIKLHEILKDVPRSDFPIYIGGPVEKNSIQFIHTLGDQIPNTHHITKDLYWGGDFKKVLELINKKKILKNQIRFFAGYSGWGENQLNNEIRENSWIINKSNTNVCMRYSTEKLWENLIKVKKKYAIWANMPKNPSLN